MLRIILGVIVGFIVWSILWVGSDQVLVMLSPDWYGRHQMEFEKAFTNGTTFAADTTILMFHLVRSVIVSLVSGYIAALVANENTRSTMWLGLLLLAAGILVQRMAWDYLPLWYHIVFLILLVPVTIAGGKLRRVQ